MFFLLHAIRLFITFYSKLDDQLCINTHPSLLTEYNLVLKWKNFKVQTRKSSKHRVLVYSFESKEMRVKIIQNFRKSIKGDAANQLRQFSSAFFV